MRALALAVTLVALAACGGGSKSSTSARSSVAVTGTFAGTYTNAAALVASGSCTQQGVTVGGGVAAVGLSSSADDLCQDVSTGRRPANASTVELTVLKLNANGQPQTITTGDYTIVDLSTGGLPAPDAGGNFLVAIVGVSRNGGSAGAGQGCSVADSDAATSGTISVTGVSGTAVAGSVNATLARGGTVTGTFSGARCSGTFTFDPATCDVGGIPAETSCQ